MFHTSILGVAVRPSSLSLSLLWRLLLAAVKVFEVVFGRFLTPMQFARSESCLLEARRG